MIMQLISYKYIYPNIVNYIYMIMINIILNIYV